MNPNPPARKPLSMLAAFTAILGGSQFATPIPMPSSPSPRGMARWRSATPVAQGRNDLRRAIRQVQRERREANLTRRQHEKIVTSAHKIRREPAALHEKRS